MDVSEIFSLSTVTGKIILAVLFFCAASVVARITRKIIIRWESSNLPRGAKRGAGYNYTKQMAVALVYLIALLIYVAIIPSFKSVFSALLTGVGVSAMVIGLAARSALSDVVSGFFILIFKPFKIGDIISIENEWGRVEDITLRHTIFLSWDNRRLIIPNEKINNMTIVNYSHTDEQILLHLEIGISYDSDIDLARKIMLEETQKVSCKIEKQGYPVVKVIELGEYYVLLRLYLWVPNPIDEWTARFMLLENIKKRFNQEGVEIPFPYRTIVDKEKISKPKRG